MYQDREEQQRERQRQRQRQRRGCRVRRQQPKFHRRRDRLERTFFSYAAVLRCLALVWRGHARNASSEAMWVLMTLGGPEVE